MTATAPPVGYPRKRHRTRRRLIRAGLGTLAETGPSGISAGSIASAAGVATGTFYNHFPTVDDFFAAMAQDLGRGIEIGQATLADVENDPAARVAIGLLQLLQMADQDPISAAGFVTLSANRPDFRARIRKIVGDAIADGVRAKRFDVQADGAATNAVLGAGLQSMRSVMRGETTYDEAAGVARLILRLLGVDATDIEAILERATRAVEALTPE